MTEIIFTSRPLSLSPISWVNAVTRMKTNSPFDHVSLRYKGYVYESTSGAGVHKIPYAEWIKGREGTYLFIYQIPDNLIDFSIFDKLEGKKYDYKANLLFLLNRTKGLKKQSNDRIFCSELIANMMVLINPFLYTPDGLELTLREYECYIVNLIKTKRKKR